jgi:NAD+ synthase (glutamine-hydrolysing)
LELKILSISLQQSNPIVGDFSYNSALILEAAKNAYSLKQDILVTPELSITGYPPEDLLFRKAFIDASELALKKLTKELAVYKDLYVTVGHPFLTDDGLKNCISILLNGKVVFVYEKQILPNKDVFDEVRYFEPGKNSSTFKIKGVNIAFLICEDIWTPEPSLKAKALGAELIISVNASPYYANKQITRQEIVKDRVLSVGVPVIYLNAVGGQDELVFDGNSFAMNRLGQLALSLPQFEPFQDMVLFNGEDIETSNICKVLSEEAQIYKALILGTRDYIFKNNFSGVVVGLSGGIDSALVLAIACEALGKEKVRAIMMPSIYTSEISLLDARQLANNLGVDFSIIQIKSAVKEIENTLISELYVNDNSIAEENIQARIRGLFLMAISNKTGRLVLTTGNKSEMAVGYCTLYGDMAGGFAVIKDLPKSQVYNLCRHINSIAECIPKRILERAPTAELKSNQKDQDTLPPYEILDIILEKFIEQNKTSDEIIKSGYSESIVNKIIAMVTKNEYKRRQSPLGIKITKKAFGRDWRYPITNKFTNY